MGILAAWTATVDAFNKMFVWRTGGRTKDENTLRTEAEHANANFQAALDAGDVERINATHAVLRRVHNEAIAKHP